MSKKKTKEDKNYFTSKVDTAIIEYNSSVSLSQKNRLYNTVIYPAFDKLAENLINTYKCPYIDSTFEDLKHDLVSFLTEKLDYFSTEAGKAYSYYTRVGINYLVAKNTRNYKILKKRQRVELDTMDEYNSVDNERNIAHELHQSDYRESLDSFITEWVEDMSEKLEERFPNLEDQDIADSVLELFRLRKTIDHFNKKSLYVLIKERTNIRTQKITKIVNILKEDFTYKFSNYMK